MSNFASYDPNSDPARNKRRALQGFGPNDYVSQVQNYNTQLYTPMDRKPSPNTPPDFVPNWNRTGWNSGAPTGNYGTASITGLPPRPMSGAPAMITAPAPLGWTNPGYPLPETEPPAYSTSSESQRKNNQPQTNPATMASPTMAQNSMQRWANQQSQGGFRQLSDANKFFWATGRIDGRAPQANVQSGLSTGGFGPGGSSLADGNQHMPNRSFAAPEGGYSWQRIPGQQKRTAPGSWNDWTPY